MIAAWAAFTCLFGGVVFHFWIQLALSVAGLCVLGYCFDPVGMKKILIQSRTNLIHSLVFGAVSAWILYMVFLAANISAIWLFPFGKAEISEVYQLKSGVNQWMLVLLLTLVIGPGEELFWRGYLQRRLMDRYGITGFVMAVLAYGAVHLVSGNLMLIAAALVCGVFWGVLFHRFNSIWINMISHAAWGLAVFIIWPFSGVT